MIKSLKYGEHNKSRETRRRKGRKFIRKSNRSGSGTRRVRIYPERYSSVIRLSKRIAGGVMKNIEF